MCRPGSGDRKSRMQLFPPLKNLQKVMGMHVCLCSAVVWVCMCVSVVYIRLCMHVACIVVCIECMLVYSVCFVRTNRLCYISGYFTKISI